VQNIADTGGKRDREHRRNSTTGQRRADDRRQHRARSSISNEIIGESADHA
jgi:hypothetical protein